MLDPRNAKRGEEEDEEEKLSRPLKSGRKVTNSDCHSAHSVTVEGGVASQAED